MKIIDRYVTGQVLTTGFFAVGVLSVVLVLGNVFKQLLDLLVNHDAPFDLIISFILYILPFSLTFTIPWGFLTSVLLVFGKMSAENELIALRSSGISIPRISIYVFVIACFCVGICLWINLDVAPNAQAKMKDALYNIAVSNPLAMFGSDKIIDEFPNRKIYVEKSEGAQLSNLLVYEMKPGEFDPIRVVYAAKGFLETDREQQRLLLHIYDVRYEQRDANAPTDLTKITEGITVQETTMPIGLQELYEKNKKRKGMSSQVAGELLARIKQGGTDVMLSNARTELSKRFSFSLASMAFVLMGIPLAITAHRKETSVGFLLSLIVAFTYFCFILLADTMRNHPNLHPEILVWSPNVLFIGMGIWLFKRLSGR